MSNALTTSSPTTVANQNDPHSPSHLHPPTDRGLEIYKQVKICRIPQFEVAADNDLHYSRVSQIVKHVHHWLIAGGQPTDPELQDHAARQRLSRAAHQLRLLRCLELATDAMEAQPQQLETTKRRLVHGQEMWREETKRQQSHPRLRAAHVVLQATEALHNLEREGEAPAEPQPAADQDLLPAIFNLLCTWRTRAAAEGHICHNAAGRLEDASDISSLVATTLNNLLGTDLTACGRQPIAEPPQPSEPSNPPLDSRPIPSEAPAPGSATEPSSDPASLNFSPPPNDSNATTSDANTPCADSLAPAAKKNPQLERTPHLEEFASL